MKEKLERLGKRLRPHPEDGGEQSKPAKGLRWYHMAVMVSLFALAVFGAVGVAAPSEAQAHAGGYYYWEGMPQTGAYLCYWNHNDYNGTWSRSYCTWYVAAQNTWYAHPAYPNGQLMTCRIYAWVPLVGWVGPTPGSTC